MGHFWDALPNQYLGQYYENLKKKIIGFRIDETQACSSLTVVSMLSSFMFSRSNSSSVSRSSSLPTSWAADGSAAVVVGGAGDDDVADGSCKASLAGDGECRSVTAEPLIIVGFGGDICKWRDKGWLVIA